VKIVQDCEDCSTVTLFQFVPRTPRLPYNLYCVGGDVKHCSLTQFVHITIRVIA